MVPYSTCDVEAWSVVQVMVTEVVVIAEAVTDDITGDGAAVVKVRFAEVVVTPREFVERAA